MARRYMRLQRALGKSAVARTTSLLVPLARNACTGGAAETETN